jgi:hypothetical protein
MSNARESFSRKDDMCHIYKSTSDLGAVFWAAKPCTIQDVSNWQPTHLHLSAFTLTESLLPGCVCLWKLYSMTLWKLYSMTPAEPVLQ